MLSIHIHEVVEYRTNKNDFDSDAPDVLIKLDINNIQMNIKNFGFKRHENVVSASVMVEEFKGEHNNPIRIYKPEVLRNFCIPYFPKTLLYWFYKQNFKWSYIKNMFLPYVY